MTHVQPKHNYNNSYYYCNFEGISNPAGDIGIQNHIRNQAHSKPVTSHRDMLSYTFPCKGIYALKRPDFEEEIGSQGKKEVHLTKYLQAMLERQNAPNFWKYKFFLWCIWKLIANLNLRHDSDGLR